MQFICLLNVSKAYTGDIYLLSNLKISLVVFTDIAYCPIQ